jgi:hypothetical protein
MFPSGQMIDVIFEDPAMGEDAVYTPQGGSDINVRVMPKRPDVLTTIEGAVIQTNTAVFDIRVSEVANPRKGDTLTFAGTTYTVNKKPVYIDSDRRIWQLETVPA